MTKELDEWVGVAAELQSKYPSEFEVLTERMSKDPDPQGSINELIRKYEKAEPETRSLIRRVSQMMLAGFEETLRRAHIHFDQWDWESDMLWTGRVSELLDRLKETGLAHNKSGAWVLDAGKAVDDLALREKLGLSKSFEVTSLTLTRSDGTTLYPTRDIAYSLYKFEKADCVINVIGVEQSLAQLQVKVAMWILGHRKQAMNFLHFPIGLLTLEGQRMSARRGRYVTFDQLLDEAVLRARQEVDKRSSELPEEVKYRVADSLAISAIRYAMLSVEAVKSTNFTWDRALNFEANSAPFINYAYTRGLGILKKLGAHERPSYFNKLIAPAEQNLILALARFPETFARSAEELDPTLLCLYVNDLAQRFHEFYEKSDISHLHDEELKRQRPRLVGQNITVEIGRNDNVETFWSSNELHCCRVDVNVFQFDSRIVFADVQHGLLEYPVSYLENVRLMDERELLSSFHGQVECKLRYSFRCSCRVDLHCHPYPGCYFELLSDIEIFCVLSDYNHVDIGFERGNIWKSASRAHVCVEVEHGTESDSDAPRRSWLLRGRHWPLEAGISLLDHVHGLRGKISSIFRDDVESSLSLQQLKLNIIDLLDSIQDHQ